MDVAAELEQARDAFGRQAWGDAYTGLSHADREEPLGPDDLVRLATAAYLVGHDAESGAATERAHHAYLRLGLPGQHLRQARPLLPIRGHGVRLRARPGQRAAQRSGRGR
ncbi:hypothetical protein [Streptomyces sp. NBC_01353]|uniref:hypothetical protein n=1 Tax=Streptomyces sp. NBC_01353 TaxID=2903835 RepID=UPI002E3042F1|nr:hypothetical protein [Streptomyces sp. NBC_01353]